MFGWLVLVMLFVVAVTLIIICVAGHIAQKRAMMGCGFARKSERKAMTEAELNGRSLFEPSHWHERWP